MASNVSLAMQVTQNSFKGAMYIESPIIGDSTTHGVINHGAKLKALEPPKYSYRSRCPPVIRETAQEIKEAQMAESVLAFGDIIHPGPHSDMWKITWDEETGARVYDKGITGHHFISDWEVQEIEKRERASEIK
ncbi:MAG: hypothetical protein MMC33_003659 [Icmadophila ericetorum]|nr:hypothetical protein [Icmadophila ericetorum]